MAMRIGKVDGQPCKRVRKNSDGTTRVQPVRKEGEQLVNDGPQFDVKPLRFIKGRI